MSLLEKQLEKAFNSVTPIFVCYSPIDKKPIYKLGEKEILRLHREFPLIASKVIQQFYDM